MVEHIRWIAWNWPVKKEAAHARCIVKTAIERIKTKWILFGLFLQCAYHLNALTNIGLWTLRFNGCWITSGPDRVTFLGSHFSTFAALKPARGPIYLLYCLLRWSNWIPSVAYNESSQCFFSPHECLFSLNARISLVTLKTHICPLAPVIYLLFFFLFLTALSLSLLFQQRIIGLLYVSVSQDKGQAFRRFSSLR